MQITALFDTIGIVAAVLVGYSEAKSLSSVLTLSCGSGLYEVNGCSELASAHEGWLDQCPILCHWIL